MKFGSLFSGIGGFDLAFERAGMTPVWNCEIDTRASEVLRKRWPNVPNLGDVRNVGRGTEPVDIICGGFPCQDLSVAGKRAGLAGERSGLWFEFARVIDELEPRWVVVENVPGLLSSDKGRDFAVILRWLVERGYGVAWRVLDAQYFGVAQRRRRVFVVGSFGSGRAAEVLFEREGVSGDPPARGEAGQDIAGALAASPSRGRSPNEDGTMIAGTTAVVAQPNASHRADSDTYVARSQTASNRRNDGGTENFVSTLGHSQSHGLGVGYQDVANTLEAIGSANQAVGVRRLTPTECERLQGFPDGWTFGADSVRYRQLGNAVAVPVAEWIGKRLMSSD